jgi:hypothetical protein
MAVGGTPLFYVSAPMVLPITIAFQDLTAMIDDLKA